MANGCESVRGVSGSVKRRRQFVVNVDPGFFLEMVHTGASIQLLLSGDLFR